MNVIHNRLPYEGFNPSLASLRGMDDFGPMSDTSPSTDPRHDRILAAGRLHFADHGFDKAKLADIAKAADVAVGTVYLRYPGKTELLVGVLRQAEQGFAGALDDPALCVIGWPDRFDAIFKAMMDRVLGDPTLPRLMALAPFAMAGGWRPGDIVRASIAVHLDDGLKSGAFREGIDVTVAAAMAHGMVDGAMGLLLAHPEMPPKTATAHLADAARRWLMG